MLMLFNQFKLLKFNPFKIQKNESEMKFNPFKIEKMKNKAIKFTSFSARHKGTSQRFARFGGPKAFQCKNLKKG